MKIEVNGEQREISSGESVRSLLVALGMGETLVAVERNGEIVPRLQHSETSLEDGDQIEIVHFVGGG